MLSLSRSLGIANEPPELIASALTVSLSFLISSCSLYKPLEFKGMEDYSFSEQDGCNPICVELSFFNPNPYNIVLKSANVKGLLGKEDIGVLEITSYFFVVMVMRKSKRRNHFFQKNLYCL